MQANTINLKVKFIYRFIRENLIALECNRLNAKTLNYRIAREESLLYQPMTPIQEMEREYESNALNFTFIGISTLFTIPISECIRYGEPLYEKYSNLSDKLRFNWQHDKNG